MTSKHIELAQKEIQKITQASLIKRKLPERFVVYRGGEIRGKYVPVTLDKNVAESFSKRSKEPLYEFTVNRSDIAADIEALIGASSYAEAELLILAKYLK